MSKETDDMLVLELTCDKEDIVDLRRGSGKVFRRVSMFIDMLQNDGEWKEGDRPVICMIQKR